MQVTAKRYNLTIVLLLRIGFVVVTGYVRYENLYGVNYIDTTPEGIARRYIIAEYEGDKETLLSITRGEANIAVKYGELDIFIPQILHEIVSVSNAEIEDNGIYHISLTVSSITARSLDDLLPSNYYENIKLKKINGKWFIIEVERDI